MGLDIASAKYGYDTQKIKSFIEDEVKVACLGDIKKALTSYDELFQALDDNWAGESKDKFEKNFKTSVNSIIDNLDLLFNDLDAEITAVGAAMSQMDDELIK